MNDEEDEIIELFQSLLFRYQIGLKCQLNVVLSHLIVFIYCTMNAKKQMLNIVDCI